MRRVQELESPQEDRMENRRTSTPGTPRDYAKCVGVTPRISEYTGAAGMKTQIILLGITLALLGCSQQTNRCRDANALFDGYPPDFGATIEQAKTGVTPRAVRADVGKFVLLKREGADATLKIIKHTHLRWKDEALGARYECFVYEKDDYSRFAKYSGEVYEPAGDGTMDHVHVECGTFKVLWSMGDWIYFDDTISAIAKTDKTDIRDVDFSDTKLTWHYRGQSDNGDY